MTAPDRQNPVSEGRPTTGLGGDARRRCQPRKREGRRDGTKPDRALPVAGQISATPGNVRNRHDASTMSCVSAPAVLIVVAHCLLCNTAPVAGWLTSGYTVTYIQASASVMPQTRESSSSPKAGRLSLSKQRSRSAHRRSSSSQTTSQGFDTSRIIYPTLQKHPEPVDHPILVLCMSELDSVPESVGDDELFETVLDKLEPWAGEEGERGYVLIVLAAEVDGDKKGKDKARSRPGVGWWLWRWRRVPRQ